MQGKKQLIEKWLKEDKVKNKKTIIYFLFVYLFFSA
jgi:hypothetical protein